MTKMTKLAGRTFGCLTVVSRGRKPPHLNGGSRNAWWTCVCACGASALVRSDRLLMGRQVTCGDHRIHPIPRPPPRPGRVVHKLTYSTWEKMNSRCQATRGKDFRLYVARGIRVCDRWRGKGGYENFLADMGERPGSEYSIDRLDNDRGYEPDNCRWATDPQQRRNKRNSIFVEWEGVRWQLNDLCEAKGLNDKVVRGRLRMGWAIAEAMTVPVRGKVKNGDLSV